VYRSSPPLVRSVLPAYEHVDAGCLCLLSCRSLFVANLEPIHHCLRDFPLSPCHTHRTYRSSANRNRTHIHCATVQYEVIPTTAPLLLFILPLPPKVTPLGDSTSVVGSSTPNTACSKVCKSCPVRANSNSLGKFHRAQHRAQQLLGSVARCQKTANLSLPRLTR
jgi:hypothetical protein